MAKPKVATASLAGCFGCHMSILDIDDRILKLIELVDFDKSPVDDIKEFTGQCLVGLGVGPIQHDYLADFLHQVCAAAASQPGSQLGPFLPISGMDTHLDQLVIVQCPLCLGEQVVAQALVSHAHYRVKMMGDLLQAFAGLGIHACTLCWVGKLGPRGLMPNPKSGTVTFDVAKAVGDLKKGKIEFRVDKGANVHVPVGKVSFEKDQLVDNIRVFLKEANALSESYAAW